MSILEKEVIVNNSFGEALVRTERYDVEGNLVDWFGELPIRLKIESDSLCARADLILNSIFVAC